MSNLKSKKMKKMNRMYEAPKAEMIELHTVAATLENSNGNGTQNDFTGGK